MLHGIGMDGNAFCELSRPWPWRRERRESGPMRAIGHGTGSEPGGFAHYNCPRRRPCSSARTGTVVIPLCILYLSPSAVRPRVFGCCPGVQMCRIYTQRFSTALPDTHSRLQWPVRQDVRHAKRGPFRGDTGNTEDWQAARRLTAGPEPAFVFSGAPIDVTPEAGR
jgi:hypothetical protein